MLEAERHRLILSAVQEKPVATVQELVTLTSSSEATIRRDIASLHMEQKLRRVRGGAEALHPPQFVGLAGRTFKVNETANAMQKRAIAKRAVELCEDGDPIIINGGTTTYQMVHHLASARLQVFTNSFPIAEHLLHNSRSEEHTSELQSQAYLVCRLLLEKKKQIQPTAKYVQTSLLKSTMD